MAEQMMPVEVTMDDFMPVMSNADLIDVSILHSTADFVAAALVLSARPKLDHRESRTYTGGRWTDWKKVTA